MLNSFVYRDISIYINTKTLGMTTAALLHGCEQFLRSALENGP
tara:strand:+ start:2868 stop:2996 length:129 start_codon:yes stop_codon:yes gene_type:complete